jgi:tetratricopeptide (TPR) repeat protein
LDIQLALAAELRVPVSEVAARPWPYWLPLGGRADIETQWTLEGVADVLDRIVGSNSLNAAVDRREFLTLSTGAFAAVATTWAGTLPGPLPEHPEHGGTGLLTSLEERIPLLRTQEEQAGGGAVRVMLDAELRTANSLLQQRSAGSACTPRLLAVIAELSRLAGWTSIDTGRYAAAESYFLAGLRAAHSGGDRLAGANLLKCLSLQLVDLDRPKEALQVASIAVENSRGGPARVRAMLMLRQARSHAALGDRAACEALLGRAEQVMGRSEPGEEVPGWATYFDQAEFAAQVAASYQLLGMHATSDDWLRQALGIQPGYRERDTITYTLWRAKNAAHLGQADAACEHVRQALPSLARSTSVRNLTRLTDVCTTLKERAPDSSAVRELDEQVRSLIA